MRYSHICIYHIYTYVYVYIYITTTPCRSYTADTLSFINITEALHQLCLMKWSLRYQHLYIYHIYTYVCLCMYYYDTLSFIYIWLPILHIHYWDTPPVVSSCEACGTNIFIYILYSYILSRHSIVHIHMTPYHSYTLPRHSTSFI